MEVRIQAIHFEIAERLEAFINKKIEKLARRNETISDVDVNLRVVKPETAMNKEVVIKVSVPQHGEIVATKTADTFEEAVDLALEAIDRQLEKLKQKK
ncbi:MAG: ribosome-associated translation inhibitor RaiA [Muribaculaceae bacterium]|nr:ribosome-associated translation inhibitor RaiA [Muribaculaceae bacterium]